MVYLSVQATMEVRIMSLDAHVESLSRKHATIDEAIHAEAKRPHPDEAALADLKRKKLRIKDEIERLSQTNH